MCVCVCVCVAHFRVHILHVKESVLLLYNGKKFRGVKILRISQK